MNASLNEKLRAVKWGEFRLGDLFTKRTIKGVPKNKENLTPNKNGFHMFGQNIKYQYPQRILLDKKYLQSVDYQHPILGYTSSVGEIGIIKEPFYRSGDNGAFQGLFSKEHQFTLKELYFVLPILQKEFDKFGYDTSMANTINLQFSLPITSPGKIDFDFMESFIAELEAERVAELSAYLTVSGLDNYELSSEEMEIIERFKKQQIPFSEFEFIKIFNNIKQGRRLKKDDQTPGNIPFVMSGTTNTGVIGNISNPVARFPKNSITIDIFGNSFYRNYDFGAGDDTGVYWNTEKEYSKTCMLFFAAAMGRALRGKYSYGKKLRSSQSVHFKMQLPTKDGKPDYDTMAILISAVQKLVIKDVVLYADRKIEKTKEIVKSEE